MFGIDVCLCEGARSGSDWNYTQAQASIWVQSIEPKTSGGAASVGNHWAISQVQLFV